MRVVSLTGYRPSARFDALPWTAARIEEGPTFSGPWTLIDTKALTPLDTDTTAPQLRSFTTELATLESGWYRIVFVDATGDTDQPTLPVSRFSPADIADVRQLAADLGHSGTLPATDDALRRLVDRAADDVDRLLGRRDLLAATPEQLLAVSQAIAWQAVHLALQGAWAEAGADDLIQAAPGLTFASPVGRQQRLSPRAIELVAQRGLIARSGTVSPPVDVVA